MKAIAQDRYGPPEALELREIEKPAVGDDGVLVRVQATSVNAADWHMMRGEPRIARLQMGLRRPKDSVLGCDLAGRVEAVGANVTRIRPGDEVFGSPFGNGLGAFAEWCLCASEDLLETQPANLTFEQAAAVPLAALTALQALREHGRIEAGQKVLIIGASGGVGTFAVQLAKSFGAEVTGVCSTPKLEMVRSLGADELIDYTADGFTDGSRRWDLAVQLGGTQPASELRRALAPDGTLIPISGDSRGRWIGPIGRGVRALLSSPLVSQRIVVFEVKPNARDLHFVKELIEAGKLSPVIDRSYTLSEIPDAIRHLEAGSAQGKLVVTV